MEWDGKKLDRLRGELRQFVRERAWSRFHTPKNLATGLSIEAAELVENFLWMTGSESANPSVDERNRIEEEIGDVVIYLVMLCEKLEIDPIAAARRKVKSNRRKYPAEKSRGNREKYVRL